MSISPKNYTLIKTMDLLTYAITSSNASSVEIADHSEILGEVEVIGRKHSVPKIKEGV